MQSQGGHLKETKIEVQKEVLKSSQQHLQPSLWLFPVWQFPHQQLKPLLTITMTTPHSLLLLAIGEDPIPQVVQKQTLPVHTPCRNMPRKRSKSTEMPEKDYRGGSRKSKTHFKVRRNSPRTAAHAAPFLRDPND